MNVCWPVAEHTAAVIVEEVDRDAGVVEVAPRDEGMLTGDVMAGVLVLSGFLLDTDPSL